MALGNRLISPISDSIFAAVITSIQGMVSVPLNVDKRYVPNYALRQRPSQGGLSLSAYLTFGISTECLCNVIQKWRTDLYHSGIVRKEKEPAANII